MKEKEKELPYPKFDQKGKIICQFCGKTFMILTPSHLKTHKLKYGEYNLKFPGAPMTSEEFKALSMYSNPSKFSKEDVEILGDETIIEEDIPVIDDDFELPKSLITKIYQTPMDAKRGEIFDFLVQYFPNLKIDYVIEVFNIQQVLVYSTISDFSDPMLKVNIEFPKTFWHNMEYGSEDPNRTRKLLEYGWKVISIDSNSPSITGIEKHIRKII